MAPLIVITGPTASGKSSLALSLAERYNGEIVCADSRTVYKYLDIGTAKPTTEDRIRVRHHLLDVVEPDIRFTVKDFQKLAKEAIEDIRRRGKVPFLVGGTGLYIDSIVLDYDFGSKNVSEVERNRYDGMNVEKLQSLLKKKHLKLPSNSKNPRHLISALVRGSGNSTKRVLPMNDTIVVAISTTRYQLEDRIKERVSKMFHDGVVDESTKVSQEYGWDIESMSGNVYRAVSKMAEQGLNLDEAAAVAAKLDRQLVKRQITWLKRHDFVRWLSIDEAEHFLEQKLDDYTRQK